MGCYMKEASKDPNLESGSNFVCERGKASFPHPRSQRAISCVLCMVTISYTHHKLEALIETLNN